MNVGDDVFITEADLIATIGRQSVTIDLLNKRIAAKDAFIQEQGKKLDSQVEVETKA